MCRRRSRGSIPDRIRAAENRVSRRLPRDKADHIQALNRIIQGRPPRPVPFSDLRQPITT
ncbi:MAG: hypothetical protein PHI73_02095 [Patescibacteria group bacterium]|nr:hypothetical protein [Patescibacteria group bacterium]